MVLQREPTTRDLVGLVAVGARKAREALGPPVGMGERPT